MKKVIFLFLAIIFIRQNNHSCLFAEGIVEEGNLYLLDNIIQTFTPNIDGSLNNFSPHAMQFLIDFLDKNTLRLIRNTIYAKHGYIFNSVDLQEHFSRFSWYTGTKTNVDNELTIDEWRVIELLRQIENNYPSYVSNKIIGCWWQNVPDDWWSHSLYRIFTVDTSTLIFWPNGIFHYQHLVGRSIDTLSTAYGLWTFDGNILQVTFLILYISNFYIFNYNMHHNITNNLFNKNIIFYNRNTGFWRKELWECDFLRNLPSWKKISDDPLFSVGG
jgi:hypothetical protein